MFVEDHHIEVKTKFFGSREPYISDIFLFEFIRIIPPNSGFKEMPMLHNSLLFYQSCLQSILFRTREKLQVLMFIFSGGPTQPPTQPPPTQPPKPGESYSTFRSKC